MSPVALNKFLVEGLVPEEERKSQAQESRKLM